MFPFRRKKNDKKQPSKLFTYAGVVLLVYIIIISFSNKNHQSTTINDVNVNASEIPSSTTETTDKSVDSLIDLGGIKNKFLPEFTIKLSAKDTNIGNGEPVICGQTATLKYSSFTEDKKEIEKDKKITFVIGEKKILPALDKAVLGMKKGGIRSIKSPGHLAYGSEGFLREDVPVKANIDFEVELLDISPAILEASAYRAIGDGDIENGYTCGSEVKLHITMWDLEGKKIYSTIEKGGEPISFIIGKSEVFVGLEVGAMGMATESRRNLIVPPSVQKTLNGNPSKVDFNFPKNQTVLVDIVSVP